MLYLNPVSIQSNVYPGCYKVFVKTAKRILLTTTLYMIPKALTGMSVRKRFFQGDTGNMLGRVCGGILQLEISKYLHVLLCSKHVFMLIPGVPLYFMPPGTLVRTVLT